MRLLGDLAAIWGERLQKASEMLSKEHDRREQEVALQNAKAETLEQQAEENLKTRRLAKALNSDTFQQPKSAKEATAKHSHRFNFQDLSAEATENCRNLKHAMGIRSSCRWQSGCPECDQYKGLRYWVTKKARAKAMVPL